MLRDAQNLEVTTDSPEAVAAIDRFIEELLSIGNQPEIVFTGIQADPECVMINALAAVFYLFSGGNQAAIKAAPYLSQAKAGLALANQRERLYVEAIDAWARRDLEQATIYHEAIAEQCPHDLSSVHIAQCHYRNLGDQKGQLQIVEKVLSANPENPYLLGMYAFGLEECYRLNEAEIAGRRATELNRQNPWAHHAVAHVLDAQSRSQEGIAWMESVLDTWKNCNASFRVHLWWHVMLYYLYQEQFSTALELYDTQIWGAANKEGVKDQINAISTLLRLELKGIEVSDRWQDLKPYLYVRTQERTVPFMDLQFVYALMRVGQEDWALQAIENIQTYAKTTQPNIQRTWLEVTIPAAQGLIAHAKGNWQQAVDQLELVLPLLHTTGGSHTQRNIFKQIYLDALSHIQ